MMNTRMALTLLAGCSNVAENRKRLRCLSTAILTGRPGWKLLCSVPGFPARVRDGLEVDEFSRINHSHPPVGSGISARRVWSN